MVNMFKYIVLVTYFTGALSQFRSIYTCDDIGKAITEPVTLDQIAGTWYEVARVKRPDRACANHTFTITNKMGADGKMKPQPKYRLNYYDGSKIEAVITLDTGAIGQFEMEGYLPFWMVKTGVDFTKYALRLQCYGTTVWIGMLGRTNTLCDEDKKIIMKKLKTIKDLGNATFEMCSPPDSSASKAAAEAKCINSAPAITVSIILLALAAAVALKVLNVR